MCIHANMHVCFVEKFISYSCLLWFKESWVKWYKEERKVILNYQEQKKRHHFFLSNTEYMKSKTS